MNEAVKQSDDQSSSEQNKGTVLVMAGGTGGHVFPALATAKYLQQQGFHIRWLGTRAGLEADVIPKAGLDIAFVDISGLRGKGIAKLLTAPLLLLRALLQSLKIIRETNPVVVLGMGGFVTGPAGLGARLLGKPLVIHEQNAIAGMTNRYLAKMATRVLLAFPEAISNATAVTGNPIRAEICELQPPQERFQQRDEKVRVVVLGGSLGALALNEKMPEVLKLVEHKVPLEIIHQCGKKHSDKTQAVYDRLKLEVEVKPFVEDMAALYGWADIVICRAGALTVSELSAAGVGAVLIPYPFAVDDHQTKNAEFLANNDAGLVIQQSDIDVGRLSTQLIKLFSDREKLLAMAQAARSLAKPDATAEVAQAVMEVSGV